MIANSIMAAAAIAASSAQVNRDAGRARPNILAVIVDQLSAKVMSHSGCSWVKTPAIDSLARNGVSFSSANCAAPLCTPQRAAMFSGYYPATVYGHVTDYPCLGTVVRDAGYATAYVGKWHVGRTEIHDDPNVRKWSGFDEYYHGNDADTERSAVDYLKNKAAQKKPFFMVVSFVNPHDCCELARKIGGWQEKYTDFSKGGLVPDIPSDERKLPALPFNFAVSDKIPEAMAAQTPPVGKNWVSLRPTGSWDKTAWRRYLYGYARLVENVDVRIGHILDALKEAKLNRNTVVIFTSDHGDGIAAHQWNQKHSFYEESVHVPFIVVDPRGMKDKKSSVLVNTGIDFFPTVVDYAGGPSATAYPGISVRPWVESLRPVGVRERDVLVAQFHRSAQGLGLASAVPGPERDRMLRFKEARSRMFRDHRYKYIVYDSGHDPEMLFDLENDPGELHNLAYDREFDSIVKRFRKKMLKHLKDTGDVFVPPAY